MNDARTVFVYPRQTDGTAVKPTVFGSLARQEKPFVALLILRRLGSKSM